MLCAAALVAVATVSLAQVPPAPRADDPAGAMPPPAPPRPRALVPAVPGNDTASNALVSGTLSRLTINPEGTVDGFVLT
ncbi:TPA: hypothetical protein ACU910_007136, partial [Burkholderia contaminans]